MFAPKFMSFYYYFIFVQQWNQRNPSTLTKQKQMLTQVWPTLNTNSRLVCSLTVLFWFVSENNMVWSYRIGYRSLSPPHHHVHISGPASPTKPHPSTIQIVRPNAPERVTACNRHKLAGRLRLNQSPVRVHAAPSEREIYSDVCCDTITT